MSAWAGLVSSHLSRWRAASFSSEDVDRAEAWVSVTGRKMLTVPGAWRAKVINGSVYVKLLHAAPTWEERASVLRMLLMLTNRAGPPLPDVDFVYASSDQDPAPSHTQVLFLSNAIELKALKSSLPVPEFTWVGWKLQLPWCQLLARLRLEASRHTWKERRDKLFFSGSLDNGRWRRRLRMLHKQQEPDGDLHIHHVRSDFFHFSTSSEASRSREAARAAQQGAAAARTRMEAPCAFRYALSIPGFGYARAGSICHCYTRAMRIPCDTACRYSSRLKSLLACGCAVVPSSGLRRRGRPRQRQRPTAIRSQPLQSPASRHTASPSKVIANLRIRGTYDLPTHSHRYTSRRRGTSSSRRCSSTASTGSRCNTPTSGITSVDSPPLCVYPLQVQHVQVMPGLYPDSHPLILLSPLQVQHVHQILPALRALRANQSLARSLARNARRFAHRTLRFERVLGYFRALLEALAARQQQSVALTSGFKSVRSREDLMLFLGLCDCDAPGAQCGRHATCCNGYNCPTRGLGC